MTSLETKQNSGIKGYLATVTNGIQLGPDNWVSKSSHSLTVKLQILPTDIGVQLPTQIYSFSALIWHCQWSSGQCVSPAFKTKDSYTRMAVVVQSLSCVQLFATPWTVTCQTALSMDSPGKHTGVGWHSLPQGSFLTQGLNLGFLHCRQIFYHLSHRVARESICMVKILFSLVYIPTSGIDRLYGRSIFNFLRKLHFVSHSGWTN